LLGREAALLGVQGPCPVGCNSVNVYIWMVNVGCSLLTRVRASPRLFTLDNLSCTGHTGNDILSTFFVYDAAYNTDWMVVCTLKARPLEQQL